MHLVNWYCLKSWWKQSITFGIFLPVLSGQNWKKLDDNSENFKRCQKCWKKLIIILIFSWSRITLTLWGLAGLVFFRKKPISSGTTRKKWKKPISSSFVRTKLEETGKTVKDVRNAEKNQLSYLISYTRLRLQMHLVNWYCLKNDAKNPIIFGLPVFLPVLSRQNWKKLDDNRAFWGTTDIGVHIVHTSLPFMRITASCNGKYYPFTHFQTFF